MTVKLDETLSALSDPTRRQVVDLLRDGPRRAGELARLTHSTAPAMSRHLRVLRRTGLGGRLVEIWDRDTGEGYEMGRIAAWEPGRRVAWTFRNVHMHADDTEVDVRFEATERGTRVTLEHSGLEVLPPDELERSQRYAWNAFMQLYAEYTGR